MGESIKSWVRNPQVQLKLLALALILIGMAVMAPVAYYLATSARNDERLTHISEVQRLQAANTELVQAIMTQLPELSAKVDQAVTAAKVATMAANTATESARDATKEAASAGDIARSAARSVANASKRVTENSTRVKQAADKVEQATKPKHLPPQDPPDWLGGS